MAFQELLTRTGAATIEGGSRASRYFLVPGNTWEQVRGNADLQSSAALGSLHPEANPIENLRASAYIQEDFIGGASPHYKIRVDYTPAGGQSWYPGTDRGRFGPGVQWRSYVPETGAVDIPIWSRRMVVAPSLQAPDPIPYPPVKTWDYEYRTNERPIEKIVYSVSFNIPASIWGLAEANSIRMQKGKIHLLGSQKWLFRGGSSDASVYREGFQEVVYSWEDDPGNPASDFETIGGVAWPADIVKPDPRPPFAQYVTRWVDFFGPVPPPYDVGPTQIPQVITWIPYTEDLSGYTSLPGYDAYWQP